MGQGAILIGVGMPQLLKLELFGKLIVDAFGNCPYLVGSSLMGKVWRDVDVRLIMEDKLFDATFGTGEEMSRNDRLNGKWASICMAFSALGKELTGLPIDFQIQKMSEANDETKNPGPRSALGYQIRPVKGMHDAPLFEKKDP